MTRKEHDIRNALDIAGIIGGVCLMIAGIITLVKGDK